MPLLDNVFGWGWDDGRLTITMSYMGTLSVNRYKTNRGIIRREVRRWMADLAYTVHNALLDLDISTEPIFSPPIRIRIDGYFRDNRVPDLANLHKVIGDALQDGLGVDDKHFRFEDGDVVTGEKNPRLRIVLSPFHNSLVDKRLAPSGQ